MIIILALLVALLTTTSAAPAAPSDLAATVDSATQISLAWSDNSDNENGFRILRCQGDPECFDFGQVGHVAPGVTSYTDTGLVPGTLYRYLVNAFNLDGNTYSNAVVATTPQIPPAAPSGLVATAGKHGYRNWVDLAWSDGSNNEASFVIERCTGAGCTGFATIASVGANVTTYEDAAVARRTTYRYRIVATNSAGDSGSSNIAAVTSR